MNILLIDGNTATYRALQQLLSEEEYSISRVRNAKTALEHANDIVPDLVVLELALPSHSGMEFLYELRTYRDWMHVPVILFSRILVPQEVQNSRTWKKLGIVTTLYKPEASLAMLVDAIEKSRKLK
jgi:DNA-binding response OmpR family regulator